MATTNEQRKFWATLEKVEEYQTIEFYHPDFGHIYLVVDKYFDVALNLNGAPTVFKPVHAEVPKNMSQTKSQSFAKIKFGRIGIEFRKALRQIKQNFGSIQCNLRLFKKGVDTPISEYFMYVQPNGIQMDEFNVTVSLGYDNPAKLSVQSFYDPSIFSGLQNL